MYFDWWRWAVANPRAKGYSIWFYMHSSFLLILRWALRPRTLKTTKHTRPELRKFRFVSEARHSPILKDYAVYDYQDSSYTTFGRPKFRRTRNRSCSS